jgi:hypothetical protein
MAAIHALASAALGAGLGTQVFLGYLVAPSAFRLVDRPAAVRLMEGIFPGYYAFGLATTAVALALAVLLALRAGGAARWGAAALLAVSLLGTVYAGHVLLPAAHAARLRAQAARAGDTAPLEFSRLHRRSVAVNIALFGVGAIALALHALAGPAPAGGRIRATSELDPGNVPEGKAIVRCPR